MPFTDIGTQLAASAVTWDDLGWIKEAWGDGPLIVKGVHNAEDASGRRIAALRPSSGQTMAADRKTECRPPFTLSRKRCPRWPESKMDFMMDGGVRNGKDVLIALSYGVKAVGLGRVYVAGLGAGGYAGMKRTFEIIRAEFERSMRLVGVRSVDEIREHGAAIRRQNLLIGDSWLPDFVF